MGIPFDHMAPAEAGRTDVLDLVIVAANSPAGRRARILGGTLAVLVSLRLRGPARYALALAGMLSAVPAAFGFCL